MNMGHSQTYLPLTPLRNYIGHTWSILNEDQKQEMEDVVYQICSINEQFGIGSFTSLTQYPPGARKGLESHKLWLNLREEMATCHLFSFIYAGSTVGGIKELRNAKDFLVPTILFSKAGTILHELVASPSLICLGEVSYHSPEEAGEKYRLLLESELSKIHQYALDIETRRASVQDNVRIGETIRYLREKCAMTRKELSERSGLPIEEITAIERNVSVINPPIEHFCAIAQSLGTNLSQLFLSPDEWESHEMDLRVTEIAKEMGWNVQLVDEFRRSRWSELRRSWNRITPEHQIKKELIEWRILWDEGCEDE